MVKKKKAIKRALIISLGFIIIIVGFLGYQYNSMLNAMTDGHEEYTMENSEVPLRDEGATTEEKESEEEKAKKALKPMVVMLLGVDSRGDGPARSDTMMVAAIHPEKEAVMLLSIPRDTYALVPDYGYTKFNHSMFHGGPPLVEKTIEEFFDLTVDKYVTIDFNGFKQVVDELGGIEIDVQKRMKYSDPSDGTEIDLQPGVQTLMGEDALGYARYRLSDLGTADSDFERIERQQEVIRAIIDEGNDFTSIFKIFSLMDILGEHIKTDLTKAEINSLIKVYHDFSPDKLETVTMTGRGARRPIAGMKLYVYLIEELEKERIKELFETFLETGEVPIENEVEQ